MIPAFMRIRRAVAAETRESILGPQQPELLVQWSTDFLLTPGRREATLEASDPIQRATVALRVVADNARTEDSWRSPGRALYFADLRTSAPSVANQKCSVVVRAHFNGPQGGIVTATQEVEATFSGGEALVKEARFDVPEGASIQSVSALRLIGC